jgi:hypothetical protein
MALLTVTDPQISGTVVTSAAVSASDTFPVSQGETYILLVINGGGSPDVVEIKDPTSVAPSNAQTFDPDISTSVTNGTTRAFRIQADRMRDPATGLVTVNHSFTTTVTCYLFRAGRV